ncbi:AlpA family transcriptional regulator [Mycobacterium avium]|uniref:AlpA family transcriptional regulator n=1 Tax=Mycobacterium avium TaxID=1764 RepID=UPI0020D1C029|nr:AlpA family transcriptional regulator [Mycobacterium avium]
MTDLRTALLTDNLMGSAEIAKFLNISRQRVTQLQAEPDFPDQLADLTMGKVYSWREVTRWALATGRRQTFREYRDAAIDKYRDADPDVNTDALIEQFDKIITQYGFSLDGAVPGTYADLLQRVWPGRLDSVRRLRENRRGVDRPPTTIPQKD